MSKVNHKLIIQMFGTGIPVRRDFDDKTKNSVTKVIVNNTTYSRVIEQLSSLEFNEVQIDPLVTQISLTAENARIIEFLKSRVRITA